MGNASCDVRDHGSIPHDILDQLSATPEPTPALDVSEQLLTDDEVGYALRTFGETITDIGLRELERPLNENDRAAAAFAARHVLIYVEEEGAAAMSTDLRCELCGSPVRLVGTDEGTQHYEPAPTLDVERLLAAVRNLRSVWDNDEGAPEVYEAVRQVLAVEHAE